ncbi:hypothetical protein [Miltoncostaea marina]|uniref:hypothetical protein n=1 Tax=Miltoncostaea marina TaxID=2843215 RepID=UPI001C3E6662|nr:hypothetical protein [Miltoncostaea marina]
MNSLTREHRMLGAAGACVLYIISLFFPWLGEGDFSASGDEVVPSWWLLLLFAAAAAAILAADALNFELPAVINPATWPAYLTSIVFIVTLMTFLDPVLDIGRKFGLFLALLFSLAAVALAVMHWQREPK